MKMKQYGKTKFLNTCTGMSEDQAEDKVNEKMENANMTLFEKKYMQLLLDLLQLRKGTLHHQIANAIRNNIQKKYDEKKAVKLALKQFREDIIDMFPDEESDTDSDASGSEEEDT